MEQILKTKDYDYELLKQWHNKRMHLGRGWWWCGGAEEEDEEEKGKDAEDGK